MGSPPAWPEAAPGKQQQVAPQSGAGAGNASAIPLPTGVSVNRPVTRALAHGALAPLVGSALHIFVPGCDFRSAPDAPEGSLCCSVLPASPDIVVDNLPGATFRGEVRVDA